MHIRRQITKKRNFQFTECCVFFIILFILNITAFSSNIQNHSQSKTINTFLPNKLKVEKILFLKEKPGSLLGDGLMSFIVSINSSNLKSYIKEEIFYNKEWKKGPLQDCDYAVIVFLKRWMKVHETYKSFYEIVNLDNVIKKQNIYYKVFVKKKTTKGIANGAILIIDVESNWVIFVSEDT